MGKSWDDLSAVKQALRGATSGLPIGPGTGRGTSPTAGKPGFDLSAESQRGMQKWHGAWLSEVYRVLQPGSQVKAFGGTRTFHRLGMAMENVGFKGVRQEAWNYATGFPKSLSVGKAVNKAASTDTAKSWSEWGTALKPAWEPILVGTKPG